MAQLSRNEMVMVPVLENLLSEIRDWTITLGRDQSVGSIGSHTTRTGSAVNAPVPAIFQLRTPPQAGRSGMRKQQHQSGFISSTIEIILKLIEVVFCQ